ncbi:MAG: hypothetical protein M1508_12035 [Nitrospirae bacterium]|nr:hypothetical protein [Nitrospirota bacterium]MCL5422695.1 hypothetical protein [Nitrospirota bacterium]
MAEVNDKNNEMKEKNKTWWRWIFAGIVIFFIVYSTFWNFKLSFELLTALVLLLFFLIYDDVKEISVGSLLSIKKEVEKVAKEQEKLSTTLNTIVLTHQAQQSQNVQVTIPASETSLEKKDEPATKELMAQLINENKEYYSLLKQWEEYSTRQNQTVAQLQDELKEARDAINRLFIEKEIAEFNNLTNFLVYNTKRLLLWLVNKGTATALEIYSQAIAFGIAQSNISVTIDVLRLNNMITITDNTYVASHRAKIFLDYIGFKDISSGFLGASLADILKGGK